MSRPARVNINLQALRHNLSRVRELAPGSRVMAIVKADAYGHGIERVARALSDADAFGVACLEEATVLYEAGIEQPIVLLEGPFTAGELHRIERMAIEIVIHDPGQIAMLEQSDIAGPLQVWLKIDTGMHRLGIAPDELPRCLERLRNLDNVAPVKRLMTHLACANVSGHSLTREQLQCFQELTGPLEVPKTIANSAAILDLPDTHVDWVRPGIMLYGISPFVGQSGKEHDLEPVMTFESRLIAVKQLRQNDPVGYGAAWRCPEDMPIGIVAAGYGDGYPRNATSGTPVLVRGRRTGLVGHPSMDMLAVDLRAVPDAQIGDPVVLWGDGLPVEEIAASVGTIPYELVSSVQKRLRFIERGEG